MLFCFSVVMPVPILVRCHGGFLYGRGEIIRNAVADKREKMYEEMQIGSDYMFRVDEVRTLSPDASPATTSQSCAV